MASAPSPSATLRSPSPASQACAPGGKKAGARGAPASTRWRPGEHHAARGAVTVPPFAFRFPLGPGLLLGSRLCASVMRWRPGMAKTSPGSLVLQLYFEPRIGATVVAQLGDGLVAPPPAAPSQQQVHRRKPPPDERQQQTSYLLDGESDEESRPWRLRNAAIRFLRRGGPNPFGGGAGSSALASERAAARYAWATRHSVMWRYQPV